jgi:hypothetical protein
MVIAQRGFSIEAGLLADRPAGPRRPFDKMQSGFGYTANLGYDFFEKFGAELGVVRTSHAYDLFTVDGAVREESAKKTVISLKLRGMPFKAGKFETVVAAGPGFFDISGQEIIGANEVDAGYSGWGFVSGIAARYHVTGGLALSLILGANFVNYTRYDIFGFETDRPGPMPKGNSFLWGLTIFHRVGIPQI